MSARALRRALLGGAWFLSTGCIPALAAKENTEGAGGAGGGVPAEVAQWLAKETGGFCDLEQRMPGEEPIAYVNLCGDVEFCTDSTLMKAYPDGLSIDIGFHLAGLNGGSLLELGSQTPNDAKVLLTVDAKGKLEARGPLDVLGPNGVESLSATLAPGAHLVSYRVGPTQRALFVDGVLVAAAATPAPSGSLQLSPGEPVGTGNPGAVLGHIAAQQDHGAYEAAWLPIAPFLFHLRSGVASFDTVSLTDATEFVPGRSVRLFHGAKAGDTTWPPLVAGTPAAVAVGKKWVEKVDETCF